MRPTTPPARAAQPDAEANTPVDPLLVDVLVHGYPEAANRHGCSKGHAEHRWKAANSYSVVGARRFIRRLLDVAPGPYPEDLYEVAHELVLGPGCTVADMLHTAAGDGPVGQARAVLSRQMKGRPAPAHRYRKFDLVPGGSPS